MQTLTKDDIARLAEYVEKRKREIRNSADIDPYYIAGNTYYISSTGDDGNDGGDVRQLWQLLYDNAQYHTAPPHSRAQELNV